MQTKLHINLAQGIIDVEGDLDLVKAVYEDFKDRIAGLAAPAPPPAEQPAAPAAPAVNAGDNASAKPKRRASSRKKASAPEVGGIAVSPDTPKLDKNLDTSKLKAFYEQYDPASAPEKILIFLKYLIDEVGVENPNTDQVYTCFLALKEKVPTAYAQAFRDTANKKGFIEFKSAADIQITIMGENHFHHDLKKKGVE